MALVFLAEICPKLEDEHLQIRVFGQNGALRH
jgi:hypothetical protein